MTKIISDKKEFQPQKAVDRDESQILQPYDNLMSDRDCPNKINGKEHIGDNHTHITNSRNNVGQKCEGS